EIPGSRANAAFDAYVIEVIVVQQTKFALRRIAPCLVLEPAHEPPGIEPVDHESQLLQEYAAGVLPDRASGFVGLALIDGNHDALVALNGACIRLRIWEGRRNDFRSALGLP